MPSVDLFAEDRAHELFITAVIDRISREGHITPRINVRSAVGGHGRALAELRTYQRAVQKRLAGLSPPDLLVVVIDANCSGPGAAKAAIHKDLEADAAGETVVACPDPHIERWFFADPEAFLHVVGIAHSPGKRKCIRDEYKNMLRDAVSKAGHFATLGGLEFARELVERMDLHRAIRNEPSLGSLVDGVRAFVTRTTRGSSV